MCGPHNRTNKAIRVITIIDGATAPDRPPTGSPPVPRDHSGRPSEEDVENVSPKHPSAEIDRTLPLLVENIPITHVIGLRCDRRRAVTFSFKRVRQRHNDKRLLARFKRKINTSNQNVIK